MGEHLRLLVAIALLLSACAKSELAKHSEIAGRLIEQRGAPDFADASTHEYPAIRHVPSGMLCLLPAEGAFEFDVFPASALNAGAQCSTTSGDTLVAWVAVQFREPTTLDIAFASAVAQLNEGDPNARAWEGEPSAADKSSPEGLPHYRIHRLRSNIGGEDRYLRLAMSERNGWYVQQLVSAPIADATATEEEAGQAWRTVLREFAASPTDRAAP